MKRWRRMKTTQDVFDALDLFYANAHMYQRLKNRKKTPEEREYKHPNGFSAKLYGYSSMSVFYEGEEVMHTGFRTANTENEVMELLEEYPEFMKLIRKL